MVTRSASQAAGFAPADRPRVAIASDGTLAAIHEPTRISVLEVPGCAAFAEIGIDPEAGASEVAWVGAPPRLIVLSRYAAHSTVYLVDPYGPRTIAEIRLEAPMKLYAAVGSHALAVGALGAAVLTASETHLTPYQFPARAVPGAAGAAGAQFVVALAGAVEEWDPHSRMPKRRIKLTRPATITAVGGSDRVVWYTTQQDPTRIDVWPFVNRGQPKAHELPEPIAQIAAHPRSDLLVCIGADSGRLFVVDLDGRAGLRVIAAEGILRVEAAGLVLGRNLAVLAAQARHRVILVPLDGREPEQEPAAPPPIDHGVPLDGPDAPEPLTSTLYGEEPPPARPSLFRQPVAPLVAKSTGVPAAASGPSLSERFSAWRDRSRTAQPGGCEPTAPTRLDALPGWRDDIATWARSVIVGSAEREPPTATPIDAMIARFELDPALHPALALLYGAHLGGEPGAAPVDVARVLGRRWDDALGRGQLAARGIAVYRDSRVRIAPVVQRALDELPARTGTMVGAPGAVALLGPCVVVAADGPLGIVAEACLASVGGAILAAHPYADFHELVLEARAYGAAPMLRVASFDRILIDDAVILVVSDDAIADGLGIPRLS